MTKRKEKKWLVKCTSGYSRRQHRCLEVKESGLLISEEYPVAIEKPKDVAIKSNCIYDKSSGTWNVTPNSPY